MNSVKGLRTEYKKKLHRNLKNTNIVYNLYSLRQLPNLKHKTISWLIDCVLVLIML